MQINSTYNNYLNKGQHILRKGYKRADSKVRESVTNTADVKVNLSVKSQDLLSKAIAAYEEQESDETREGRISNARQQLKSWNGLDDHHYEKIAEELMAMI